MSIIRTKEIENHCMLSSTYGKAEVLCSREAVQQMELVRRSSERVKVQALVQGSGRKKYQIWFDVTAGSGGFHIGSYHCECPAFASGYGGICKHLAAAMLELNYQMEDWELQMMLDDPQQETYKLMDDAPVEPVFWNTNPKAVTTASGRTFGGRVQPAPVTSKPLMDLMASLMEQEHRRFCMEHADGRVDLEPTLNIAVDSESLELRVGADRYYVVKNIAKLLRNVQKQELVRYGKSLEFVHSESAFSKDAQKLLQFIKKAHLPQSNYSYGTFYARGGTDARRMDLEPYMLDELLEMYAEKSLFVHTFRDYDRIWMPVLQEDPVFPVLIDGQQEGKRAQIEWPVIILLQGVKRYYVCWQGCIYICSEEFSEQMGEVLKLMAENWLGEERQMRHLSARKPGILTVYETDYPSFTSRLLPLMEKYMKVQIQNVDFSGYQVEEGHFELYFDMQENQDVICTAKALYGKKEHNLAFSARMEEAYRDISTEYELRHVLQQYFPERSEDGRTFVLHHDDEKLASLVEVGIGQLENFADIYASEDFKKIRIARGVNIAAGVSIKGGLLQVSWNVEGMSGAEVAQVLASYQKRKKYHRLRSGELLNLEESGFDVLARLQEDLQLTKSQLKDGMAQVPLYRALYVDTLMRKNEAQIQVRQDAHFVEMLEQFEDIKNRQFDLPKNLQAQLRTYQKEGFQWMCLLAKMGFGGILADEMGLGKTLQTIAYLCTQPQETHLVVCPASLVYNWEAEIHKFAPALKVGLMAGSAQERSELIEQYRDYDIIVTSYDLLKRDLALYEDKKFGCEVIDEAQYIKNPSTQAAKAVKTIESRNRFALTGTPIENRLSELWSIFAYLMPGYLYSYKHFKEVFEEAITTQTADKEQALNRLHAMIQPFVLRRLKQDVLKELPKKVEEVVYSRFDTAQKKLYQAAEKRIVESIGKKSGQQFQEDKLQILAEITRLRQICCDPALLYENYKKGSAKLETCMELVRNSVESGHSILLFSQFASMLERIRDELEASNISSFLLTGATSKVRRREMVEQFQQGRRKVFLISLKAGGTGLNLTAADIVIHYDPWWNLAAQNQATDRAHRIGQQKPVTVMKLIAQDTIEERILQLQEKKQSLADQVMSQESVSMASFTREELLELFDRN